MDSSSATGFSNAQTLDLKILTQIGGADTTLHLQSVSLDCTVGNLKTLIRDNSSLKPAIDRQRLIYHGHVLARDSDTLAEVFGANSQSFTTTQTLHLVVRDSNPQPGASIHNHAVPMQIPISSDVRQGQIPHPHPLGHNIRNETRTNRPLGTNGQHFQPLNPMINQTGGVPQPSFPVLPGTSPFQPQTTMPAANIPPVDIQNMIMNHRARVALMQQQHLNIPFPPQIPPDPTNMTQQVQSQYQRDPLSMNSNSLDQHTPFPAAPSVQRSGEASANRDANGQHLTSTSTQENQTQQSQHNVPSEQQPSSSAPATEQAHHTHGGHHHAQWTFSVNGNPQPYNNGGLPNLLPIGFPMPGQGHFGHFANPVHQHPAQLFPEFAHQQFMYPSWSARPTIGGGFHGSSHARVQMTRHQTQVEALNQSLNSAMETMRTTQQPQPMQADRVEAQLQTIVRIRNEGQEAINQAISPSGQVRERPTVDDIRELQALSDRFQRLYREICTRLSALQGRPTPTLASDTSGGRSTGTHEGHESNSIPTQESSRQPISTSDATAYLLLSPSGPQAIVYNNQDVFTSLPPATLNRTNDQESGGLPNLNPSASRSTQQQNRTDNLPVQTAPQRLPRPPQNPVTAQQNNDNPQPAGHANAPGNQGAQQDVNDPFRAFAPIATHLWFLIRIFGLVWFFSNGTDSYKLTLLILATVIYFAIQMGFLVPQWNRARRHFEALLGLHNNEQQQNAHQPQQQNIQQERDANAGRQTGARPSTDSVQQGRQVNPDPQETAERLLREAREREPGRVQQWFGSLERGVALFFASFWPGLGERAIAMREEHARRERDAIERIRIEAQRNEELIRHINSLATRDDQRGEAAGGGVPGGQAALQSTQRATELIQDVRNRLARQGIDARIPGGVQSQQQLQTSQRQNMNPSESQAEDTAPGATASDKGEEKPDVTSDDSSKVGTSSSVHVTDDKNVKKRDMKERTSPE